MSMPGLVMTEKASSVNLDVRTPTTGTLEVQIGHHDDLDARPGAAADLVLVAFATR